MALNTFSGSTPAFWESTKASLKASIFAATMIWLANLVTPPAPMSPVRTMFPPITCISAKFLSKTSCLPPTMMASVPAIAPGSPPLTGASSISTPFSAQVAAIRWDTKGAMELMSIITEPLLAPSNTPSGPRMTFSESAESGSMVMMVSLAAATSLLEDAPVAPSVTTSSWLLPTMSYTVREYPALSRLRAMGFPMIPSPMNPICSAMCRPPQVGLFLNLSIRAWVQAQKLYHRFGWRSICQYVWRLISPLNWHALGFMILGAAVSVFKDRFFIGPPTPVI